MAFALALQAVHDLPNNHGEIIFTATTAIVVLTVSHFSVEPCLLAVGSNYIVLHLSEICEALASRLGQKKIKSKLKDEEVGSVKHLKSYFDFSSFLLLFLLPRLNIA